MKLNKAILYFILLSIILIMFCGCHNNDGTLDSKTQNSEQETELSDNQRMSDPPADLTPPKTPTPSIAPSPTPTTMYIKLNKYGSKLNIRETPSISGNIIDRLEHGDMVKVLNIQDGWARIEYNQDVGYVNINYLVDKEPSQLLPAHDNLSPDDIYINVYKEKRSLELWNGNELIGEYSVALGFNPIGHKEKEGDGKTPEGAYYVCVKNPNSRYYLSLGVSYPGISDAQKGLDSGLITQSEYDRIVNAIHSGGIPPWNTPLGGQIMIHGSGAKYDWTEGCVAVENDVMDILWEHCKVGTHIFIYP